MNEHDPLEVELAALKPYAPSPELREQIAQRLMGDISDEPRWRSIKTRLTADKTLGWAAAMALAACLIIVVALQRGSPPSTTQLPETGPPPLSATTFDDSLPTFWAYQRALIHSSQDLDALLDKHAMTARSNDIHTPRHRFISSDARLLLQGDL